MKLNSIQRAFAPHGKTMSYGVKIKPLFDCDWLSLEVAVNKIAAKLPVLRANYVDGEVVQSKYIKMRNDHPREHFDAPTCFRVSEADDGYWFSFTHEFIDGWTFIRLVRDALWMVETGNDAKDYLGQADIGRIQPAGKFEPIRFEFDGIEGEGNSWSVPISNKYLTKAKADNYRVQDFMAHIAYEVLGGPNVCTTKIIPGFENHMGHYSMYSSGTVKDGRFSLDCSHENMTRYMIAKGLSSGGNCFVGSMPLGQTNFEVVDMWQHLRSNQMGRVQVISFNDQHRLRLALNKAIPDQELILEKILERLE
jgi:hypothetical protein